MGNDIYTKPATETKETYKGKVGVPSTTDETFEAVQKIPEKKVDTVSSASLEMLEGSNPSLTKNNKADDASSSKAPLIGAALLVAALLALFILALLFGWI